MCVGRGGDDLYSSRWPVAGSYHQISAFNGLIALQKYSQNIFDGPFWSNSRGNMLKKNTGYFSKVKTLSLQVKISQITVLSVNNSFWDTR